MLRRTTCNEQLEELLNSMKGNYVLIIKLAHSKDILVGKLGYIHFPQAFYAYVGSAMNGFEARLPHHLRRNKKTHWHIDYFLEQAVIREIILCPNELLASSHSEYNEESYNAQGRLRMECFLAQALAKEFQYIPGFGSSDCKCRSHLYFANRKDRLKAKIVEVMSIEGYVISLKLTTQPNNQPVKVTGQDKYAHSYE